MKKLLTILLLGTTINLQAQCLPECNSVETLSGNIQNTAYNGTRCFYSNSATITNSVNFNNWSVLSFSGTINLQQTINVNNTQKLYLTGVISANQITLAGFSTVYVDGDVSVSNLVSNNGHSNVLFTTSKFTYQGVDYFPGDTLFTSNGTGNYVAIKSCTSVPLSIKIKEFYADYRGVVWVTHEGEAILQYSEDARNWVDIVTKSPYTNPKQGFYRLKLDTYYSETIKLIRPREVKIIKRVDMMGRETTNTNQPHIEIYNDGSTQKVIRL